MLDTFEFGRKWRNK